MLYQLSYPRPCISVINSTIYYLLVNSYSYLMASQPQVSYQGIQQLRNHKTVKSLTHCLNVNMALNVHRNHKVY